MTINAALWTLTVGLVLLILGHWIKKANAHHEARKEGKKRERQALEDAERRLVENEARRRRDRLAGR